MNVPQPNIIVVDNLYPADAALLIRDAALADDLELHPERHKGRRGRERPISEGMQEILVKLLQREKVTGGYCVFQACLAGEQIVFHADDNDYAAILYLTPDAPYGTGTSFYASKATGLRSSRGMTLDDASLTFDGKLLDRTAWECVDMIGNVFNRLVVWDARMLHAATEYFGTEPKNGRLFEMMFFDAK
jgi:hypothetical protein